jgi:phosphoribosylformylglycinamidine cyclo-ligase
VVSEVGTFGAMFSLSEWADGDYLLVTSVDGVGTKLMIASMMGRHDTVGQDIVNHCVNDILVQGARPVFFMDYIAAGALTPEFIGEIVEGLVAGCQAVGCALIGGETAEMPGVYEDGQYDLVGFVGGVVERSRLVSGERVEPGDVLLGLGSDGLHTNGYSLARKVLFEAEGLAADSQVPELGCTIGEELLRVHRCYAPAVLPILADLDIRGMAHITGGGLPDNVVRFLPKGCRAVLERGTWPVPPIFELIQRLGQVPEEDIYHTFNMGLGFVVATPQAAAEQAAERLSASGESVYRIGHIAEGERGVEIL